MNKANIVVSLRSKGLSSINKSSFTDINFQAICFATEALDIITSFIINYANLSWTGWISLAITIFALAGLTRTAGESSISSLNLYFPLFATIILPLIGLVFFTFSRRHKAMLGIAQTKALVVGLCLLPSNGGELGNQALDDMRQQACVILDEVHKYLQHKRPWSRHFYLPYITPSSMPNDTLYKASRELGVLQRNTHLALHAAHSCCSRMAEAGCSDAVVLCASDRIVALHASLEVLMGIKEMRTPLLLRCIVRWFTSIVMPIFLASFWAGLNPNFVGPAVAGLLAILSQTSLMVLLDLTVILEDPFDDTALDALSLYEMMDHVHATDDMMRLIA
ncbi:MAG: hypothetical protein WDW38_003799 [Sanguina aurantia]